MAPGAVKPKIIYFPVRGRAEVLKLALAAAGVEFDFEPVDTTKLKSDLDHYHFGQVPRYIDDEVDVCQAYAALRHIGRKFELYGKSRAEQARVEEVIEGAHDLVVQMWQEVIMKTADEQAVAKEKFWLAHMQPGTETAAPARGAHAAFLSRLLAKSNSGFFVDSGITIADVTMHQAVENIAPFFQERFAEQHPDLMAHFDRVSAVPGIAAYLRSEQRLAVHSSMVPNLKRAVQGGTGA